MSVKENFPVGRPSGVALRWLKATGRTRCYVWGLLLILHGALARLPDPTAVLEEDERRRSEEAIEKDASHRQSRSSSAEEQANTYQAMPPSREEPPPRP